MIDKKKKIKVKWLRHSTLWIILIKMFWDLQTILITLDILQNDITN